MERIHTSRGRTVTLTPSKGQSEESIAADLARGDALAAELQAGGTTEWKSYYRWIGPVKIKVAKEVGPPCWCLPRLGIFRWDGGPGFSVTVGWRYTAYRLFVLWTGWKR